jgi:hypothetical protein
MPRVFRESLFATFFSTTLVLFAACSTPFSSTPLRPTPSTAQQFPSTPLRPTPSTAQQFPSTPLRPTPSTAQQTPLQAASHCLHTTTTPAPTVLVRTDLIPRKYDYEAYHSLSDLVHASPLIVIATALDRGEIINGAYNVSDPTQQAPDMLAIMQVYQFQVQRFLKGASSPTLKVGNYEGSIYSAPVSISPTDIAQVQATAQAEQDYTPFQSNEQYLLFLFPFNPRVDLAACYFAGGAQPWRFRLPPDGSVILEPPQIVGYDFIVPATATAFIAQIEQILKGP